MSDFKEKLIISGILLLGGVLLVFDILDDLKHGSELYHVLEEASIIFLGLIGVAILWRRYFASRRETLKVSRRLDAVKGDLDQFRLETKNLFQDINDKIDQQFSSWGLSEAEKEVTLLALKGMSTKEISSARNTSEKTVSQQLGSVYQKSGLHGRQELTAFFLEDLFSR